MQSNKIKLISLLLLILAFTFVIYIPALWGDVYMDDYKYLLNNMGIRTLDAVPKLLDEFYFKRGFNQLTYSLDYYFYGENLTGFHFTSIILHLFTVVMVWYAFRITKILFSAKQHIDYKTGLIAALIFAILPINTQPVAYLISRANIVATLFFLLGYIGAVFILQKTSYFTQGLIKRIFILFGLTGFVALCMFLGLGGKEIVLVLPAIVFIVLLMGSIQYEEPHRYVTLLGFSVPFIVVFGLYFLLRYYQFGHFIAVPDAQARPVGTNIITQFAVIHLYYWPKILFPFQLFMSPMFEEINTIFSLKILLSFLIFLVITGLAILGAKRDKIILLGFLWFYIALIPTSSIVPLWDIVAERRIYLSSIGLAFCIECLIFYAFARANTPILKKGLVGILSFLLLFYAGLTVKRNYEYTSSQVLWQKELEHYPRNARAFTALMMSHIKNDDIEEAKQLFKSTNINQLDVGYFVNMWKSYGNWIRFMLMNKIDVEQAEKMAEKLVDLDPESVSFLTTLQLAYMVQEKYDKAEPIIDKILKKDRRNLSALQHKAIILSLEQKHDEVIELLERTVKYHPDSIIAYQQLKTYYEYLGRDTSEIDQKIKQLQSQETFDQKSRFRSFVQE